MTIYKALEIYKIDTNNYPTHLTWVVSTSLGIRIPALSGVVTSMPVDPRNNLA